MRVTSEQGEREGEKNRAGLAGRGARSRGVERPETVSHVFRAVVLLSCLHYYCWSL